KPSADSLRKFSTVLGASSSKNSISTAPWFVCIVALDMGATLIASGLQRQPGAVDLGAVDALDHLGDVRGGHLEEREALEHAHVAHCLAVQAGGTGHRG